VSTTAPPAGAIPSDAEPSWRVLDDAAHAAGAALIRMDAARAAARVAGRPDPAVEVREAEAAWQMSRFQAEMDMLVQP